MPRSDEHRGPESTFGYDMERVRVLKNRRADQRARMCVRRQQNWESEARAGLPHRRSEHVRGRKAQSRGACSRGFLAGAHLRSRISLS